MLAAPNVRGLRTRAVADSIVALDYDTANSTPAQFDGGG
jgi:hypothetical protein